MEYGINPQYWMGQSGVSFKEIIFYDSETVLLCATIEPVHVSLEDILYAYKKCTV